MAEKEDKVARGKRLVEELAEILRGLKDRDVKELLGKGALDDFLNAVLDPSQVRKYKNIGEFLLANKNRATILALLRHAITHNYSFKSTKGGEEAFVSPSFCQWFDDGVMLLEGKERFAGAICLYQNGKQKVAIAARDVRGGENMGPQDFEFISLEEFNQRAKQIPPEQIMELDEPVKKLKKLFESKETDETKYQDLLETYPWVLGAQYRKIQPYKKLDDANIPDFTGVRVHDGFRDIIEIKQPFLKLFRSDGNFASDFNDSWNQAERYLDFVRAEKGYLRRKGLGFDNPKCYLIVGLDLTEEQLGRIRVKQGLNPAIEVLTYNDLLVFMESTISFVKRLKNLMP